MKRLVIEDVGKPGDPLLLVIEEALPIAHPVLGMHIGDYVWVPVEQRLMKRKPFYLSTEPRPENDWSNNCWPFEGWQFTQTILRTL